MRKLQLDEQEVIATYEKYENARQVSEIFGCSSETIYRILKKHGIPRTHRHPKTSNDARISNCNTKYCPAVIRLLYVVGGYKTSQIADATSIPIASVCNTLRTRYSDVFKSRRDAARNANVDAIECEYLAGASSYELGEKYGVDRATISKWMRKRGHHRCRGHGVNQIKRHKDAVRQFVEQYPDSIGKCKTWRKRGEVRRRFRIASRPHDGSIYGLRWQDIYEHNGHNLTCWICKKKCVPNAADIDRRPSIDHVIPLSNGGTDTYDNTRIACVGCNRVRSNKVQLTIDFLEYEQG